MGFAALYGAANGMITIVRALLPPELFGREDYGTDPGHDRHAGPARHGQRPFRFRGALGLVGQLRFGHAHVLRHVPAFRWRSFMLQSCHARKRIVENPEEFTCV